jgi:hypothetical protein
MDSDVVRDVCGVREHMKITVYGSGRGMRATLALATALTLALAAPAAAQPPDTTPPLPVASFLAVGQFAADGSVGARLSWTEPGGADVAGVHVRLREGAAPSAALSDVWADLSVVSTTATIWQLKPATIYTVSAYAFDEAGNVSTPVSARLYGSRGRVTVPRTVSAGVPVRVTATLTNLEGKGLGNRSVEILVRAANSSVWRLYRRVDTDKNGNAITISRPTTHTVFGVRFAGEPGTLGFDSGTTGTIRVAFNVSARLALTPPSRTNTIRRGQSAKLVGSVSPRKAGQSVQLQRLVGGAWRAGATVSVASNGSYSFTLPTSTRGVVRYRVYKRGDSTNLAGASPPVVLTVV